LLRGGEGAVPVEGRVELNIFHKLLLIVVLLEPLALVALAVADVRISQDLGRALDGMFLFVSPAVGLFLFAIGCIDARRRGTRTMHPVAAASVFTLYGLRYLGSEASRLFHVFFCFALLLFVARRLWEVKPVERARLQESVQNPPDQTPPQG